MQIAKYRKHIFLTVAICSVIAIGIFAWLNRDNMSSAADARNFNASNIMSDFVMTNKNSMSEAQIQSFLVSKNPCNDRNISKASNYPNLQYNIKDGKFVCLAEESFDGESAARIIWQAAQDYSINPQVLIVLLEKEQGLVTDTWPNHVQYRFATGYGCPDTADCNGKYYGFKNQVRNAANFFRAYQTGNTGWYKSVWPGDKYTGAWQPFDYNLQYHPNTGCGTVGTRIENRATASLYSYTPYRPNQAALNAQTGHGDGCSSYGNRNFWMFFSDWFGNTQYLDTLEAHPSGSLVVIDNRVFLIGNNVRHWIKNSPVFESYDYSWDWLKRPTTGDMNLPESWPIDTMAVGTLYRSDSSPIYTTVLENNILVKKQLSYDSFIQLGYRWDMVRVVPESALPTATSTSILMNTNTHPDGTKVIVNNAVYLIDHGTLRHISPDAFTTNNYKWSDVVNGTSDDAKLRIGERQLLRNGAPIRDSDGYYFVGIPSEGYEFKRAIGPWTCYADILGFTASEALQMPSSNLPKTQGGRISC